MRSATRSRRCSPAPTSSSTCANTTTFDRIDLSVPVTDGNLNVQENYDPGKGGDIVVVRAYYEWPVFVRLLGNDLSTLSNGTHLLVATAAFRNEPFPW